MSDCEEASLDLNPDGKAMEVESPTLGDSKSAASGSEGSDGFEKVEEIVDHPPSEPVTEIQLPAVATDTTPVTQPTTDGSVSTLGNLAVKSYFSKGSLNVKDLIYWRDVRSSAVVFSLLMLILISLSYFSVILVFAYLALSLFTVTGSIKLFRFVQQTVNGIQQPNPFKEMLDSDITLSEEKFNQYAAVVVSKLNYFLVATRDLVLIKSVVPSLKFSLFCWFLGHVGACFNGLTLLTIGVIIAFTCPAVYEKYQVQIDEHIKIIQEHASKTMVKVRSKLPGQKPKSQ